jgi:2-phosphoglycerate kinase
VAPRVLLIGGSSHSGKSTLAARLAERPGWTLASTDRLARHPGRPWVPAPYELPPHVRDHYRGLSVEELLAAVVGHYARVWPLAEALIRRHAEDPIAERLVLEGSALWPPAVAALRIPTVSAVWLTAGPDLFEARILSGSGYGAAPPEDRLLIEKFLARTIAFDRAMTREAARLGLPSLMVDPDADDLDALAARSLALAQPLA